MPAAASRALNSAAASLRMGARIPPRAKSEVSSPGRLPPDACSPEGDSVPKSETCMTERAAAGAAAGGQPGEDRGPNPEPVKARMLARARQDLAALRPE